MMDKIKHDSEIFMKSRKMIEDEYFKAKSKHPKFCDEFTMFDLKTAVTGEVTMKLSNSEGPYQADLLLQEELWEATAAYLKGNKEHALQELAQCGAVILRMMEFVQNEMDGGNK